MSSEILEELLEYNKEIEKDLKVNKFFDNYFK
jgi:hypothetical protein